MKQATVKELMKKAMISLLSKKKIIDITVTDLIKEAGIARASFYRVYSNIDQILADIVLELKTNFETNMLPALQKRDLNEIRAKSISFLRAFKERKVDIFNTVPENVSVIISKIESIGAFNIESFKEDSIEARYYPPLMFIIINSIIRIWQVQNFKETPEELTDLMIDLIGRKYLSI